MELIIKTLLFLDEIQSAPKAITALRYFYEELLKEYHSAIVKEKKEEKEAT